MQHFKKRIVALAMALAMLLSLMPVAFAADAADFPDMPAEDDPSYAAVKAAVDNGLLTGENGKLNLEGTILRSTISKIIVSAFGATDKADLSAYTDVRADGWYAEWLAKASQMGIMHGNNGKMMPSIPMTRQEAYVVLSRALNLGKGAANDLKGVKGAGDLAAWAVAEVAPLVKAGYVTDLTAAGEPITRGEFVQVMHNIFSDYISEAGTVTEVGAGSVMVNVPNVTLKGCTVKGDLVIADGVGDGDVTLDNVKVEGRLVVRGGGVNSVRVINNSNVIADVVITKVNGSVRVFADATSGLRMVTVSDGRDDVIIEGTVGTVSVASSETPVVLRNATVSSLEVTAPSASVTMKDSKVRDVAVSAADAKVALTGSTTVTTIKVDSAAEGVTVTTRAGTKITTINADTDVTVNGGGKVENTKGEGTVADSQGNKVETAPSTSGNSGGLGNLNRPSDSGTSTGPVASHTHVWAAEWSKDDHVHWHACTAVKGCTARADENIHAFIGQPDGTAFCVCGQQMQVEEHEHVASSTVVYYDSDAHCFSCTVAGCLVQISMPHTLAAADAEGKRKCTKCDYTTMEQCAAGGHTITEWTNKGNGHTGTCSVCGNSVNERHIWGTVVVDGKVTCTKPGCDATQNVSGEPHVHKYGEWRRDLDSLTHVHSCVYISTKECNYDGAATERGYCVDGDKDGVCDECNAQMCEHDWVDGEPTEATCIEPGYKTQICSKCKEVLTYTDTIVTPATGNHNWVNEGSVVDCKQGGEQSQRCENCGAEQTIKVEGGKEHSWGDPYQDGTTKWFHACSVCDAYEEVPEPEDSTTSGDENNSSGEGSSGEGSSEENP